MTEHDKGKHTVFYHRYHIVWITKYRYKVLTRAMTERVRTIVAEVFKGIVKDKKIGTLIDEFGFFEHKQFYYVNHHQGYDHRSQEINVTIEDHEGNFQIGDNIIHPIILHDGRLDLLDYLGYQNEFM